MDKRNRLMTCTRWVGKAFLFIFIVIIIIMVIKAITSDDQSILKEDEVAKSMTFEVKVPENTIPEDTVHIYLHTQKHYKMDRVGDFTYRIRLTNDQLQPGGNTIKYRYTRNGDSFNTAEYLEPDTNDYFWTEKGRSIEYSPGTTQYDEVARWRWFPEPGTPIVRTSQIEPEGDFLPRTDNMDFRSGQIIEDLYLDAYYDFFESTAAHLSSKGYRWVEIDPPWQWAEEDGLPRVKNLIDEAPNYPDDQTLIDEINAYKDAGLSVMLGPQLCCTELPTEDRSDEWWDAYFSETTKFLVHFGMIAEETGVDAMHYAIGHQYWEDDYDQRWSQVFQDLRKVYSGEVGEMVWSFGENTGEIIPDASFITWGDELDYFYIAIDTPISLESDPTNEQLKTGAGKALDGTKQLHDVYGKPVFVRTTYFNVKETWRGSSFYSISSIPWWGAGENELIESIYEFGPEDQARVVNAYFTAIAERPWIIGYAQFGYSHWENPLTPDLSVRGKPAEDIWKKWNEKIYQEAILHRQDEERTRRN